jgi:hypothetical protein
LHVCMPACLLLSSLRYPTLKSARRETSTPSAAGRCNQEPSSNAIPGQPLCRVPFVQTQTVVRNGTDDQGLKQTSCMRGGPQACGSLMHNSTLRPHQRRYQRYVHGTFCEPLNKPNMSSAARTRVEVANTLSPFTLPANARAVSSQTPLPFASRHNICEDARCVFRQARKGKHDKETCILRFATPRH